MQKPFIVVLALLATAARVISGVATLVLTVRARKRVARPLGTLVGFAVTSLAAVSLSVFLLVWGLAP